ncbi:hypothetical protein [Bosea rubneri]|uniref:Uncharacterized protein n=1 Tax=Bosea rubneri TaxID=3075434 RepID=A0ABU3SC83_9HYPH|nr:hypothetical protein [Bosea sp. ZW T0_25]MDU0342403.1 hypothetical protein [Bosea sp. ZW T0_25]
MVHTVRGSPLIVFIFWTYFFSPMVIGRAVGGVRTLMIALVVRGSLSLRDYPRRHRKLAQRPDRGGDLARPALLADDDQGRAAAGAAQHAAEHGQR